MVKCTSSDRKVDLYFMRGIKKEIIKPVIVMTVVFIVCTLVQSFMTYRINSQTRDMRQVYFEIVKKADELKLSVVQVQQWLTDISATRAAEGYDDGLDEAANYAEKVREIVSDLKQMDQDNTEQLDSILESFEPYYATGIEMANAYISKGPEGGNVMMEQFDSVAEDINTKVDQYVVHANDNIEMISSKINFAAIQSGIGTVIVLFIVLSGLYVVMKLIEKKVVAPIGMIKEAAGELASGNLALNLDYKAENEIGELSDEMRSMAHTLNLYISDITRCMKELEKGNLNVVPQAQFQGDFVVLKESIFNFVKTMQQTIREINLSSKQVSQGSGQIAKVAQSLAEGAEEQNLSVEKLSSVMDEMKKRIEMDAEITDRANEKIEAVGQEASRSMEQMKQMVLAMQQISESSNEIVNIIKTIESIASQTNLLSLNASIEAARAGEAGKGFAVVAGEVAALAGESVEAVNNTKEMVDKSKNAVEKGSSIVENTAKALESMEHSVEEVIRTMSEIEEESREQTQFITSVINEVSQISEVVLMVSSTAQESEATSEELLGQAEQLNQLVEQFKI